MSTRFDWLPLDSWRYMGPAFDKLARDLKAVEDGQSGGVITSGPYTLDPNRAPAGSIVAVSDTDPVLTHVGTRFVGTTAGASLPTTDTVYDTAMLRKIGTTGTLTFQDTGLFGECLAVVASSTATKPAIANWVFPAGVREAQMSFVMRLPRPTIDVTVLTVYRTGGTALTVLAQPGAAGNSKLIVNDQTIAGWEYSSPDFLSADTVRVTVAAKYVDGTGTSKLKVAFWRVGVDGSETQIGTTYANAAVNIDGTGQNITGIQFGRLTTNAGSEGLTYRLDAARLAHGAGAYDLSSGFLRDERLYPNPVA